MPVESAIYLGSLTTTNPPGTDPKSQGDDHIRLIKAVLKNSFPGFTGQVIVRGDETQGATVNDFVLTVTADTAPTGLQNGMLAFFKADHTNTGPATFGINAIPAIDIVDIDGDALVGEEIVDGRLVGLIYDEGSTTWVLITPNDRTSRNGDTIASLIVEGALSAGSLAVSGTATGTTPALGDATTKLATTAFVAATSFSTNLPGQTDHAGEQLTTDGSVASWQPRFHEPLLALGII